MTEVFFLETDILREPELWAACLAAMPAARREKLGRLRRDADRRRSLGAGVAMDWALWTRGLVSRDEPIALGASGKPYLPAHPGLHFNLSHSGSYALCALSDREVGADVERVRPAREALLRRVCTPAEAARLLPLAPPARDELFCRLWTVKESVMKRAGTGMALGPETVDVSLGPPISAAHGGEPVDAAIVQRQLSGAWLAVCAAPGEEFRFTALTSDLLRARYLGAAGGAGPT